MVLSAIAQFIGWFWIVKLIRTNISELSQGMTSLGKWLIVLPMAALFIKFTLQLTASHPGLTKIAYEFHAIVIGFLHLVFLAITSLFILGYIINNNLMVVSSVAKRGIYIFTAGIIFSELLLMSQGVAALFLKTIPLMEVYLFFSALIMFAGVLMINIGSRAAMPGLASE
jgi:hypothetical protein